MENRNEKTKALVESGMISALSVVLTLIIIYIGLDSVAAVCIIPIPITVIYIRQDLKYSVITLLISSILVSLFSNPIQGIANALVLGSVGIFLGYLIKKKYSSYKILAIMGLVVTVVVILYSFMYSALLFNLSYSGMADNLAKTANTSLNISKNMGGNNAQGTAKLNEIQKYMNKDFIEKALPGVAIVGGYLLAYLNYAITKSIFKRLRIETRERIEFTKLYIPSKIGAFIIIIYLFGTILTLKKILLGSYLTTSAQVVLLCVFTLQGICVFSYFLLNKYKLSKGIVAIAIIAPLMFNLSLSFAIIGLVDLIFDFRKVYPNRLLKK